VIEPRDEDSGPSVELGKRRVVKMIPVEMREVDVVERRELRGIPGDRGEMPPAPKVGRTCDPRIHQDPSIFGLAEETGMAQHLYAHRISPALIAARTRVCYQIRPRTM
jgi:hypothetical protein